MILTWLRLPSMTTVPNKPWALLGVSMSKELLPTSLCVAILPWRLRSLTARRTAVACQLASGPENNPGTAQCANRDEAYGYAHALQCVVRHREHCSALAFTQCLQQSTWGKGKRGFEQVLYHLLSRQSLYVSVKYS